MTAPHVLIAGATEQIGWALATLLLASGWDVTGLSRGKREQVGHPTLQVNLGDAADCHRHLAGRSRVTHLVGAESESVDLNTAMLSNVLDALEAASPTLARVHVVHGTKYYGHNRMQSAGPFREDQSRSAFESFYYVQEDLLVDRSAGKPWSWTISRPHTFCDFSAMEPRSIFRAVAVYAALLRAQGLPLAFPGTPAAFAATTQFTWLLLIASAVESMATAPACAGQAFNVVNEDPLPWSVLWPHIAKVLGMQSATPASLKLTDFAARHEEAWQQLVHCHGLRLGSLASLVQWPYADYAFSTQWNVISSMDKARRFGFPDRVDSRPMWDDVLAFLTRERIVPTPH